MSKKFKDTFEVKKKKKCKFKGSYVRLSYILFNLLMLSLIILSDLANDYKEDESNNKGYIKNESKKLKQQKIILIR